MPIMGNVRPFQLATHPVFLLLSHFPMVDLILRLGTLVATGCILASCQTLSPETGGHPSAEGLANVPVDAEPMAEATADQLSPGYKDPGGKLGLRQLIEMALANSPLRAEAEGNLRVALSRRKTVGEWEDPEFRSDFDWDDVRVTDVKTPGQGTDVVRRNEQFGTRIRLYPPNPFEIRAQLDKAMADITYAEFYRRQVGRELITEVRRLYEELQFLQEDIRLGQSIYALETEEYQRLKELLEDGHIVRNSVDRQRLTALGKRDLTTSREASLPKVRVELAALVGLEDPGRMEVTGLPLRPLIEFGDDTASLLTEMAFINNLKLADLDRLQKLAAGDLRAFRARKIPWVSHIESGRDRTFSRHLAINDTWFLRLAFNVPIFSLFSKKGEVYQEQIRNYQRQAERYRKQIQLGISGTLSHIREARQGLSRFDRQTREISEDLRAVESNLTDPSLAEHRHERRLLLLSRARERLEAEEAYHDALLDLEKLIGGDIQSVFRQRPAQTNQ